MPKAAPVVRFGAFELNIQSRELRKQGMRIRIEAKPFQILELLLEYAGEVVTRQRLCEKLWPDTYVGFEHSLNTAVNKLRSILCDFAQSPRFVETLPRLGYRFIAPVQLAEPAAIALREEKTREEIKGKRVPHSSRPPRVQAPRLQARSFQTAP